MSKANEVRALLAVLGIASGLASGVLAGRVAAPWVEADLARIASGPTVVSSSHRVTLEPTSAPTDPVTRYKVPVTRSQPSIGPSDALVTIIEWCDLYGRACRESDALLAEALARHPREVRRVFRHFAGADRADAPARQGPRDSSRSGPRTD